MISYEEALSIINQAVFSEKVEEVELQDSLHRILAGDLTSDMNMPPFDKSAMDGYACRNQDIQNELTVIETIPAGKKPEKKISENTCAKIMTGAIVPDGADCVLKVEDTETCGENKIRFTQPKTKSNICYLGEDVKKGDIVLKSGTFIKPQHIAVMASIGAAKVPVSRQPRVGVIPTGDEIVEPDKTPLESQIRNSNGAQLMAQLKRMNIPADYLGIARDAENHTLATIMEGVERNDIILLTGGVSKGDFDLVPDILEQAGFDILFRTVAVQPGKPTLFARKGDKYCFGLPGNPVSSFIQFELMVKPLLFLFMGTSYKPPQIKMAFGTDYQRRKSHRRSFMPVYLSEEGTVMPVEYHGSAHIHSLIRADGLISIPVGETTIKKGDWVYVRQI